MANWTGPGFVGQMFKAIAEHIAPSGMPSLMLWGDEPTVRERLKSGVASLECYRRLRRFSYVQPRVKCEAAPQGRSPHDQTEVIWRSALKSRCFFSRLPC